jgi:hypothetical protein
MIIPYKELLSTLSVQEKHSRALVVQMHKIPSIKSLIFMSLYTLKSHLLKEFGTLGNGILKPLKTVGSGTT